MARPLDFGMFDWLDAGPCSTAELYEARLQLIEMAEQAGFYGYHMAEHHGTPLGMAPSPALFLAALTQRTSRIRFGPMAYLLPLYHPLRLIEELCMLDHLSDGRGGTRGQRSQSALARISHHEVVHRASKRIKLVLR